MGKLLAERVSFIFLLLLLLVFSESVSAASCKTHKKNPKPCKRLVLHLHDFFRQTNYFPPNATSAPVYVFDDPVTRDESVDSPPAGRARGFFLYDRKDTVNTLYLITLNFNSSQYTGTLTTLGNNEHERTTRDLTVVGGTGDFFMARGITTLKSEVVDLVESYFPLRMDIKLYECH